MPIDALSARVAREAGDGVEECWVELAEGRMRYLRTGLGPPLILVHGLLGYSFSWRYVMPGLAERFTVYAPDMLGAGFSDRSLHADFSMAATARRVLEFMGKLGLTSSPVNLLGTSHGGAVAMLAAAQSRKPESKICVRRLVLVAPVNPYSAHGRRMAPFFGNPISAALFRLTVARTPFFFRYGHSRLYADQRSIPPGSLEGYLAPLAVPAFFEHGLAIVRKWTADLKELEAALPDAGKIPALLLWGEKDPAVHVSSAKPLAKYFPRSQTVILPRIGHLPYEECPKEFNCVVLDFLRD